MKNTPLKPILILFALIIAFNCSAQEKKRYIDPDLDKFVGTWLFKENGKAFKIILKKEIIQNKEATLQFITGYHSYKQNGKILDGYTDPIKNTINFGVIVREPSRVKDQLNFDLEETTSRARFKGVLKFIKGNPDQLKYTTNYFSPPSSYNLKDQLSEPILPKEVILKRLK